MLLMVDDKVGENANIRGAIEVVDNGYVDVDKVFV